MTDLSRAQSFVSNLELAHMAPDELAHHGVIGMKWGVRKDRGHEGERAKTKKIASLDKKFALAVSTPKTTFALHNEAARRTNKNDIDRINNKPAYKGKDFSKPSPLRDRYYKEHQDAYIRNLEAAAKEFGTNASGTQRYAISVANDGSWDVYLKDVSHADEQAEGHFKVNVTYSKDGHILKLEPSETLSHELADDELAHYGILGMKWGRRKPESVARDQREARAERNARNTRQKLAVGTLGASVVIPKAAAAIRKRQADKVHFRNTETGGVTKGKYPSKSSSDHVESRELLRKKTPELSNKDIQRIVDRLQKEQRLNQLNPSNLQRGKKAVATVVATAGAAAGVYNLIKSPPGQAAIARGQKIVKAVLIRYRAVKAFG